jgi:ubiquinol-cytochrome c reductase cytochrome c subunit
MVLIGMFVALAMGTGVAQSPSAAAAQGDVAAGKKAYLDYACYYCHGTVGQGSTPAVGVRIARVARSVDAFRNYVRRPTGRMSSYPASVISDGTLTDIYAYLRSLPEPSKPLPAALEQLRKR